MIAKFQKSIESALENDKFLKENTPLNLFQPIEYTLSLGGKRIRPTLCLIGAYLFSNEWERYMPQAIGIEIFHNFTLLHDDLMDKSPIRRGKPTVYKKWDNNTAILSGDAMSILAYQYICNAENKSTIPNILEVFTQTALDVCRGQQYDMDFEKRYNVSTDEYIGMIRLKTAVLIGASLQIGAISAGANIEISKKLYDIGVNFGLAFQIQDDILDVYGDEKVFGKPIGKDICNAKKTFLLLYTKSQLSCEDNKEISYLLNLPQEENERKITEVRKLYDKIGAREVAQNIANNYIKTAFKEIEEIQKSNPKISILSDLFNSLINREK